MPVVEASFELSQIDVDIFSDVLFRLEGTLGFITIYQSINIKLFELPQCFTVRIILLLYAVLCVFVLYSHYGDGSYSKKLDGHQAFQGWTGMYTLVVPSLSTKFIKNSHQNLPV